MNEEDIGLLVTDEKGIRTFYYVDYGNQYQGSGALMRITNILRMREIIGINPTDKGYSRYEKMTKEDALLRGIPVKPIPISENVKKVLDSKENAGAGGKWGSKKAL